MNNKLLWVLIRYRLFRRLKTLNRVIGLVLLAILFLAMAPWLFNTFATSMYNKKSYTSAAQLWSVTRYISVYEKDIPEANKGNALFREEKYKDAVKMYETALRHTVAKRECVIRLNLGLTQKYLGDIEAPNNIAAAISEYGKGINALTNEACLKSAEYGKITTERLAELTKRAKELSLKQMQNKDRPNDNEQKSTTDDTEEERLKQQMKKQIEYMNNLQQDKRREASKEDPSAYYDKRTW